MALRYGGSAAGAGSDASRQALAQALGWFSIGLGVAELVAPQHLARLLGMEGRDDLIRTYGAREIVTGVGILAQDDPTPWMWARVGGDALDLGTLAMRLGPDNPQRTNVGLAMAAVAGVTALDVYCARALAGEREAEPLRIWDYSDRSGLPRPPAAMRGAARLPGPAGHADPRSAASLRERLIRRRRDPEAVCRRDRERR